MFASARLRRRGLVATSVDIGSVSRFECARPSDEKSPARFTSDFAVAVAHVFDPGDANGIASAAVDVKSLHAKIGELRWRMIF
jgi:hypothetical protein